MSLTERAVLLESIDRAYNRKSWHGTNLRGSIRGVDAREAAWRPEDGRHNIHEIVVHAAYWKYVVRRRLLDEKRGSFPLRGSDWFERPEGRVNISAWKRDIALLDEIHQSLRAAIVRFPIERLHESSGRGGHDNLGLIAGIAAHDVYHAGQIQLLKRLQRST